MNNIKVSIIVSVYNTENYLKRCLDSLVCQTLNDIEIVIVNDGSQDNSQLIIDQYYNKYSEKIIPLIKENGGLSETRNLGLKYAKGEYISFIDSDDYVEKDMCEKMYDKGIQTESDVVCSPVTYI
jgi:glycosyltransferase involved in cell wall biosynthesis